MGVMKRLATARQLGRSEHDSLGFDPEYLCLECKTPCEMIRPVPRPHWAKYICPCCSSFRGWVATPTEELGSFFRMPFGKYKGKTLDEIASVNPGYLEWAASNVKSSVGNACLRYLTYLPGMDGERITPAAPSEPPRLEVDSKPSAGVGKPPWEE